MDQKTAQLIEKFRKNPALAQAAQNAVRGNTKELAAMLSSLMQSPEGMAVMNRINESAKK